MIYKTEFRAMGSQILAALDTPPARTPQRLDNVSQWFEAWETTLSRFRPESELSRLNRSAGEAQVVSTTLWEVFQLSLEAYRQSDGLVTPLVMDALVAAGYHASFDQLGTLPSFAGPGQPIPDLSQVKVGGLQHTIQLPPNAHLDFGGIAKGWAAHKAAQKLKLYGPALVDAGGDIDISGLQADGKPWPIGITDPFSPERDLYTLRLGRCGVATSGRDYRRWKQGANWKHHIIDPRTGEPAETDVFSVTIIAPTVTEAEVATKVILISGSQDGLTWLRARPALAGLLILENGRQLYSSNFEKYLWE
jgi:thiamine biosynthesis lipoprotein